MLLNYRHSIIKVGSNTFNVGPTSIGINVGGANAIPLEVTIASGENNYYHVEAKTSETNNDRWIVSSDPSTVYLYISLDTVTAERSLGIATQDQIISDTTPTSPSNGQHWFDTNVNKMKVYSSLTSSWIEVIRIFVASYTNGVVTSYPQDYTKSQIGVSGSSYATGKIVYDNTGTAVRVSDGSFLTTESDFLTYGGITNISKLEADITLVKAKETIPAFSVVAVDNEYGDGLYPQIKLADYTDVNNTIVAICGESLETGQITSILTRGVIINTDWDWEAEGATAGGRLWIGTGLEKGQLVSIDPYTLDSGLSKKPAVAKILHPSAVMFQQSFEDIGPQGIEGPSGSTNNPSSTTQMGSALLSVESSTPLTPVVVETSDPRLYDSRTPTAHQHAAGDVSTAAFGAFSTSTVQAIIEALETNKLDKSGGTISGTVLTPSPSVATQIANKTYVDTTVTTNNALMVLKAGSTMTGFLTLVSSTPINNYHAAPKIYVDNQISSLPVLKTGSTMTGFLVLKSDTPTLDYHATPKIYVDAIGTIITDHISDATDAHDASAISYVNTSSGLSAINVQTAIDEVENRLQTNETTTSNHISDITDAHDASAISYVNTNSPGLSAVNVQDAIDELELRTGTAEGDVSAHLSDTTDAHDASAISYVNTNSPGLSAINVQDAIDEIEGRVVVTENHISDATDAHDASAISYVNTNSPGLSATNIQDAIDEIEGRVVVTENHISDATDAHDASAISYVNTSSGLSAINVQTAVDEVENRLQINELAFFNHFYNITDAHDASAISYVNSNSPALTAINVQDAVDQLEDRLTIVEGTVDENVLTVNPTVQTVDFEAVVQTAYLVKYDVVSSPNVGLVITLPDSAVIGDRIRIFDFEGTFSDFPITLTSDFDINGSVDDYVIMAQNCIVDVVYVGSNNWKVVVHEKSTPVNIPNTTVSRDENGDFSAEVVTINQLRVGEIVFVDNETAGIKIAASPDAYVYADITGRIVKEEGGPNAPGFVNYRGTIKQYQFAVSDEVFADYQIPHDYVMGSDLYIHVHWSHTSAAVTSGSVTWGCEVSYASIDGVDFFGAPVTVSESQAASDVQYYHHVTTIQLSNDGGTGGLLDSNSIEPHGVILLRLYLSANTISAATDPFVHYCDIRYMSAGVKRF